MENVENVENGYFTGITRGDIIEFTTKDGVVHKGELEAIDDNNSRLGYARVTISPDGGITHPQFYHNQIKPDTLRRVSSISTVANVSTVANDILTKEQDELACIKDESFTGYQFGDMTLAETPLYQSDLKFLDTLVKMKALHQGLHERNEGNKQITAQQCQTIVEQIMETDTNLDSLIEYLVKLPEGHFKATFDGDIIYTRQKQVDFLTPVKTTARGQAGKALESQNNMIINKGVFSKTPEFDGCIFLSNRIDKGEKNVIVLKPDGKIIGLTAGGNIITREYKKKRIVSADGIITDIEFETVTSASRSVSRWSSSLGSGLGSFKQGVSNGASALSRKLSSMTQKLAPAPAAGGRRTRRKSNKSSTRKGGQRGGGRCRDACKKVSKKRK